MNQNNLLNLTNDPVLPNLLPEEPIYDELFQLDDLMMPIPHSELTELNRKIELLTIDANTHGLRIEVERAKRQRAQMTIRQLRQDLSLASSDIMMLKNEMTQLRDHQNAINFQLDSENARTNTLSFRSLSRIGQILFALVPSRTLSPEISPEVKTLLQELNNTIRQFGIHYFASHA